MRDLSRRLAGYQPTNTVKIKPTGEYVQVYRAVWERSRVYRGGSVPGGARRAMARAEQKIAEAV